MTATIIPFPRKTPPPAPRPDTIGTDPFVEAYRAIRRAERAGLPVPPLHELLPQYVTDQGPPAA